jgi:hypothetical protein
MATRRNFLKLVGGGLVLAAAGGGVWAATRDPRKARLPWQTAGQGESDLRRQVLSYALLAPNPHNRQPWLAGLGTPDVVTLYCDLDRRLPHTDPFDRQITVGLGAFLELMTMAAAENGHRTDIRLFPEGEPQPRLDARPVAQVTFTRDAASEGDPLFRHVAARRSNKEPYDASRPVPADALAAIAGAARRGRVAHVSEPAEVDKLRQLAWAAMETELATPRTLKESVDLMRIGRAEIEANPDGIDLSGALIEGLALSGLLSREAMLDPSSSVFRQQSAVLKPSFDTATAFLWLATAGNARADQIAAGRDYVRLNLAATGLGIAMQPFSQALQEYAEMRPHFLRMRDMLGIGEAETLQMFVRLGYGPDIEGAPRWPLDTRIRSG